MHRSSFAVACIALVASGCISWQTRTAPAPGASESLGHVLVGTSGGPAYELWNAQVVHDTLSGDERIRRELPTVRVAVAVSSIVSLRQAEVSPAKTTAAVVGVVAGVAIPVVIAGAIVRAHQPTLPSIAP
jgi:hypothetical protein